ncbi:MAG: hypothetical protein Q8Q60_04210 [Candidatus Chromulinivorax sp.]|nr:hypothetical protein [Candidatus Chromulinivorax sp.]
MNKRLVVMSLLFAGSILVGDGQETRVVDYTVPTTVYNSDTRPVHTGANQSGYARVWSDRQLPSCPAVDDDVKVVGMGCCTVILVTTLLVCLLPQHVLHVNNTTKYPITVSCPGSINSLQPHSHGRLRCTSPINGDNVYGYTPWNSAIKRGYASGHVVNEGSRNGNIFDVSISTCTHDCSESSKSCSGSGKSRHCSSSTTYYDETVTWTPVYSSTANSTAAVHGNLRGWNGEDSEYISDVSERPVWVELSSEDGSSKEAKTDIAPVNLRGFQEK